MKIYINGRYLTQKITGVQRFSHEMLSAMDDLLGREEFVAADLDVIVLAPKKKLKHNPSWKNIKIKKVGIFSGHLWEQLMLPIFARNLLFCPGNTVPIASLFFNKNSIVVVHDLSFRYFPAAYSSIFKFCYTILMSIVFKYAKKILTVSNSERMKLIECYPQSHEKISVIRPGGLPMDLLHGRPKIEKFPTFKYILYVGSLSKRKNIQGLINATLNIVRKDDLKVVFVGDNSGIFNDLDIKIPDTLRDKFIFLGRLSDKDLISWYRSAECFVFPSFYESFGSPIVEAMACGCPVIASNIPALREIGGEAVAYCNPNDPLTIELAIKEVIENRELRDNLIFLGHQKALTYTWHGCAKSIIDLFEETVSNNK